MDGNPTTAALTFAGCFLHDEKPVRSTASRPDRERIVHPPFFFVHFLREPNTVSDCNWDFDILIQQFALRRASVGMGMNLEL